MKYRAQNAIIFYDIIKVTKYNLIMKSPPASPAPMQYSMYFLYIKSIFISSPLKYISVPIKYISVPINLIATTWRSSKLSKTFQQKTEFREEGRAACGRCLPGSIFFYQIFYWRFTATSNQQVS